MKLLTILNIVLLLSSACHAGNDWDTVLLFDPSLPKGIKSGLGIRELKDMLHASKLTPIQAPTNKASDDVLVTTYVRGATKRTACIYRFKEGLLGALTLSESTVSEEVHLSRVKNKVSVPLFRAFSIEQAQVSSPVNWLVVLAVILVAGTDVLVFILNRR